MPRTPKGASSAADSKASKINSTQMTKGRRSHDPNRSLASLPVARIINNVYSFADNQVLAKGLMIVLASLADLKESTMPTGPDNHNAGSRPIIRSFNDIVQWAKGLTFDSGFLVVNLTGSTGTGRCISRGEYFGKSIHITSGGLTYSNKRGTHTLLCGTISDRAAHAFIDLTDPFVAHTIPALSLLGIISIVEEKNRHEDDDLVFEEEDEIGNDISYALLVDLGKVINPKLIYKKIHHKKASHTKSEKKIVVNDKSDYMITMDLPSSSEEEDDDEEDGNPDTPPKTSKRKPRSIRLNAEIQEEDDEDEDEDDD